MRTLLFILIILLSAHVASAQFAIIKDDDGYVNVRSGPGKGNNLKDTLHNGSVVYIFEYAGNLASVDYRETGGYIYKTNIHPLNLFDTIPAIKKTANSITFQKDNISVYLTETKFIASKHKLTYKDHFLSMIDGRQHYGTDGDIPRTQYGSITITINGKNVILPKQQVNDLYEPNLHKDYTHCHYDRVNDMLYLFASNSDAAGSYEVLWIFEKGIFSKREIASGF